MLSQLRGRVALFGNREEKAGKEAAAQAELDRLAGMQPSELGAEIMRAFGPDGLQTRSGHRQGPVEVTNWLMSSYSSKTKYTQPLLRPVMEGLQALENAGLVETRGFGDRGAGSTYHATRAGEEALADGSVAQRLSA
jgi:hypothetical protein